MINIKCFVFSCLFLCWFVHADYICVENATDSNLRFRLGDAHYDVYEYQFSPKECGLGHKRLIESGSEISLEPERRIMLRTVYSYNKSGVRSFIRLLNDVGSIVFSNELCNAFKLSDSLEVKVLSRCDVLNDDFAGLADRVYRIVKSKSAPVSPKMAPAQYSAALKRSLSDSSLSKEKDT